MTRLSDSGRDIPVAVKGRGRPAVAAVTEWEDGSVTVLVEDRDRPDVLVEVTVGPRPADPTTLRPLPSV